ncbi:MAG: ABC transporter ATP-binding protein [Chloroflexi bacterium]|nr:ABC transporter ATP-binding protein [Chloroflexota bacterium]
MPGIALVNASFRYGRQLILRDINLETSAGEFLGIIGPNGCGKSTLLKGMSGLLRPHRGYVTLNGVNIAENNHGYTARNIALVPQNVALPALFTVMDIVLMGRTPHLKLLQYEGKLDISIAIDAMEATRTVQLADKRIDELSGGEKQRVLIARALAQQAGILLLISPHNIATVSSCSKTGISGGRDIRGRYWTRQRLGKSMAWMSVYILTR